MKRSEIFFGLLRIPVDFCAAFAALLFSYWLRAQEDLFAAIFKKPDLGTFPPFPVYVKIALISSVVYLVVLALFKLYSMRVQERMTSELRKIFMASLIWLMAAITYYFFLRQFPFSRLVLFYAFALTFIFVGAGRIIIKSLQVFLLKKGVGQRRVVLVGENNISEELKDFLGFSKAVLVLGVVKDFAGLEKFAGEHEHLEEIIQTQDDRSEAEKIIAFCRSSHLQYHFVPDLLEVHRSNVEISAVGGLPLISLLPTPLDGWGKVVKRAFDIAASAFGLVVLSPFFAIIAAAIKLDSPGTVFFRYLDDGKKRVYRVGEKGKRFHCLKFRTMKAGTHSMRYGELADKNLRRGTPLVKIKNDPRVTRVGAFLRRFSIDEMPQLWNVLKGEMSFVGPRPHLPEEVERYERQHQFLLTIKPGITGLAQISGRSDLPFSEEVRLDTYYIENWSLLLDIKIMFKTIFVVLRPYGE